MKVCIKKTLLTITDSSILWISRIKMVATKQIKKIRLLSFKLHIFLRYVFNNKAKFFHLSLVP